VTGTEFVDLCLQLRALGATEVTAGELHAKFAGHAKLVQPPKPEEQLTPELAAERDRLIELGRAPRQ
jgi:hypothetical protein